MLKIVKLLDLFWKIWYIQIKKKVPDGVRHRTVPLSSIFKVIDIFKQNPAIGALGDVAGLIISNFSDNTIEYIDFLENSMDMSDPYTTYFVLEYIFVTTSSYGRTYSLLDEPILKKVG